MKKSGFLKFKNTKENPLCLDEDENIIEECKPQMGKPKKAQIKNTIGDEGKGMYITDEYLIIEEKVILHIFQISLFLCRFGNFINFTDYIRYADVKKR